MKIGIMGAPVDSTNLGCMALSYSLIYNLEQIEKETGKELQYIVFDWKYNEEKMNMIADELKVERKKISFAPYVMMVDPLRVAYHTIDFIRMIREIRTCDCVIDVTEGDSFSDIYGDAWFRGRTRVKKLIERLGVPLILAPQTYGPYQAEKNRKMAIKAIRGAAAVFTRDTQSREWIRETAGVEAVYTTDLAFSLPHRTDEVKGSDKTKIGLNASNLLYFSTEMKDRKFTLATDYAAYIDGLMKHFMEKGEYEVYLISHVSGDYEVHKILHEKYPDTHLVPNFQNPIEAKNLIRTMDAFIGARMHGTIAAFTTGVACIPTSYSPKFANLFSSIGYLADVDLCKLSTEEALKRTAEYISGYRKLQGEISECLQKNRELMDKVKTEMQKRVN